MARKTASTMDSALLSTEATHKSIGFESSGINVTRMLALNDIVFENAEPIGLPLRKMFWVRVRDRCHQSTQHSILIVKHRVSCENAHTYPANHLHRSLKVGKYLMRKIWIMYLSGGKLEYGRCLVYGLRISMPKYMHLGIDFRCKFFIGPDAEAAAA